MRKTGRNTGGCIRLTPPARLHPGRLPAWLAAIAPIATIGSLPAFWLLSTRAAAHTDPAGHATAAPPWRFQGSFQGALPFNQETLVGLSLFLGILIFAVLAAVLFVRARTRLQVVEQQAEERIGELSARLERAEGLLAIDQNVLVVWPPSGETPEILCDPGASQSLPDHAGDVLAFGKWLDPESAIELEARVAALRSRGEGFTAMLRTRARRGAETAQADFVEADGRSAGGRAVLRLRDLSGPRREVAEGLDRQKKLARDVSGLRALLDAVPMPAWLMHGDGRLAWVNAAYARAIGADSAGAAVLAGTSLVDPGDPEAVMPAAGQAGSTVVRQDLVTIDGDTAEHDIVEVLDPAYRAGLVIDISGFDVLRRQLDRRDTAHAESLDLAATALAVFGSDQRLIIHNRTFADLWGLDPAFLRGDPEFGAILDRLRAAGRLQEPGDYRTWRGEQIAIFSGQAGESGNGARDTLWRLPGNRAVRVMQSRQADGLVSCLFVDVTKSFDLESRLAAITEVQRETLDSLDEGIAVFATDGRLKLNNPAFAAIWRLGEEQLSGEPHVETVIRGCQALYDDGAVWSSLRGVVTGFLDSREPVSARLERPDRSVIDMRAVPLPDGATLVVFTDVSDSARIERALRDRNEALMAAARIKNEFVHKVSYELRAPLTNIIGFAQLMSDGDQGTLSEQQREYAGHILTSSSALLAIINDILDLATIDAGVMELEYGNVDIAAAIEAASDSLRDRMAEAGITLSLTVPDGIGSFEADEKRVRQVLFNLLSNAIGFSDPGQTVTLACRRETAGETAGETGGETAGEETGHIVFEVRDTGPGIPEDVRRSVFERFESHSLGTRHRGAGLGLSIVKSFVELHGGSVDLDSSPGRGTLVACRFPPRRTEPPGNGIGETRGETATVHRLDAPGRDGGADQGRWGEPPVDNGLINAARKVQLTEKDG